MYVEQSYMENVRKKTKTGDQRRSHPIRERFAVFTAATLEQTGVQQ